MSFSAGLTVEQLEPPLVQQSTHSSPRVLPSPSTAVAASSDTPRFLHSSQTPFDHILTHQEKKQQKMPKRKADSWPTSILTDPDVLSLDDEGRFVLCKVCHVHYAVHGGKKPKPVIMNSGFRTRAWEVHKERTNSHRLEKKHVDPRLRRVEHHDSPKENTKLYKSRKEHQSREQPSYQPQEQNRNPPPPPPPSRTHMPEDVHSNSPVPPQQESQPPALQPAAPMQHTVGGNTHTTEHAQSHNQGGIRPAQHSRPWASKHRVPLHHHQTERPATTHARSASMPPNASDRMNSSHAKSNPLSQPMTMEQMDGLMRWRNMHDDVSRALGSSRYKRPLPDQYRNVEMRSPAQPLAEAEDFSGNNEKVAKKLRSLDAEYDAKILKRPEVFCDRRSDTYKQYWGTLRDVYTSGSMAVASPVAHNESASVNNKTLPVLRNRSEPNDNKETREDLTTPDDTGSSESTTKPTVVHDQALINAIDRLTGVISKQFSQRATTNHTMMMETMHRLTQSIDDMRSHQNHALGRLIHLQEQKVQLMEAMLQHKLRKTATNNNSTGSAQ